MRIRFRPAAVVVLALIAAFSLGHVPVAFAATTLTEYVCDFEGGSLPDGWTASASAQATTRLVATADGTMLRQEILPTATSNQGSVLSFSPPGDGARYELDAWFFVEQAYKWGMTSSPFVMVFPGGKAAGMQVSANVNTTRGYYGFFTGSGTFSVLNKSVRQGSWHHVVVTYDRDRDRETIVLDGLTVLSDYAMDTGGAAPARMDFYAAGGWSPGNAIVQYVDNCVVRVWSDAGGPPALTASQPSVVAPEGSIATLGGLVSDPDGDAVSLTASRGGVTNNGDGTWTWSQIVRDGPSDGGPVTITASDGKDGTAEVTFQLIAANVPPMVTMSAAASLTEGSTFSAAGGFTDPGLDAWSATVDYGDGSGVQPLTLGADGTFALAHAYADDGEYAVTVNVADKDGGTGTAVCAVSVANLAPTVEPMVTESAVVAAGYTVDESVSFSDAGTLDTHSALWDWGDGTTSAGTVTEANGAGTAAGSHTYLAPGLYVVSVTVTDDDGGSGSAICAHLTVFAPAGSVTGGGSLMSEATRKGPRRGRAGSVTFAFNAKYAEGADKPTGNAVFQLHATRATFKATGFDWLLVTGKTAVLQGVGTIDGKGSYAFLLEVTDGSPDRAHVRIWDTETGADVFDSRPGPDDGTAPGTPVQGSIVVHK